MLDPAHAAALREHLAQRFARQKQKFEFECRILHPERGSLWVILRGLIVYQAGAACRIVGSLRDITDRMEAQARLVESEARARAVIETAFDAIVTVDEAGRIVEFNAAASRIFGHSREQVIGRRGQRDDHPRASAPGTSARAWGTIWRRAKSGSSTAWPRWRGCAPTAASFPSSFR